MNVNFAQVMSYANAEGLNWAELYRALGVRLATDPAPHAKGIKCLVPRALLTDKRAKLEARPSAEIYQDDGVIAIFNNSCTKDRYQAFEAIGLILGISTADAAERVVEYVGGDIENLPEVEEEEEETDETLDDLTPFKTEAMLLHEPGTPIFDQSVNYLVTVKGGFSSDGLDVGHEVRIGSYPIEKKDDYAQRSSAAQLAGNPIPPQHEGSVVVFSAFLKDNTGWVCSGTQLARCDGLPLLVGDHEVKYKTERGSKEGLVFLSSLGVFANATRTIKTEGPMDGVALQSLTGGLAGAIFTTLNGAGSFPYEVADAFKGKRFFLCHDCDWPGQKGAFKIMFNLVGRGVELVANIDLGYDITDTRGKDVRDWVQVDGHDSIAFGARLGLAPVCRTHDDVFEYVVDWHCNHGSGKYLLQDPHTLSLIAGDEKANPIRHAEHREKLKAAGLAKGVLADALKKHRPKKEKRAMATPVTGDDFDKAMRVMQLYISKSSADTRSFQLEGSDPPRLDEFTSPERLTYDSLILLTAGRVEQVVAPPGEVKEKGDARLDFILFRRQLLKRVATERNLVKERIGDGFHLIGKDKTPAIVVGRRFYVLGEDGTLHLHNKPYYEGVGTMHGQLDTPWVDVGELNAALIRMAQPEARVVPFEKLRECMDKWIWKEEWMARSAAALLPVVWMQGMLRFRSIVPVSGESHSGKSTLLQLMNILLIDSCPLAQVRSEAAVRNNWGSNTLPMLIDEFDKIHPERARQGVLSLLRLCVNRTRALKSNKEQGVESRKMCHVPVVCGIGNYAEERADVNRQVPLTLCRSVSNTLQALEDSMVGPDAWMDTLGYNLLASTILFAKEILTRINQLRVVAEEEEGIESRLVNLRAPFWAAASAFALCPEKDMLTSFRDHIRAVAKPATNTTGSRDVAEEVMISILNHRFKVHEPTGGMSTASVGELINSVDIEMQEAADKGASLQTAAVWPRTQLAEVDIAIVIQSGTKLPHVAFLRSCLKGVKGQLKGSPYEGQASNGGLVHTLFEGVGGRSALVKGGGVYGQGIHIPLNELVKWTAELT